VCGHFIFANLFHLQNLIIAAISLLQSLKQLVLPFRDGMLLHFGSLHLHNPAHALGHRSAASENDGLQNFFLFLGTSLLIHAQSRCVFFHLGTLNVVEELSAHAGLIGENVGAGLGSDDGDGMHISESFIQSGFEVFSFFPTSLGNPCEKS